MNTAGGSRNGQSFLRFLARKQIWHSCILFGDGRGRKKPKKSARWCGCVIGTHTIIGCSRGMRTSRTLLSVPTVPWKTLRQHAFL